MYVDISNLTRNGKTYTRTLLRESYREEGKVKHRTLMNISNCSDSEIAAIKLALAHKKDLTNLTSIKDIQTTQGRSIGAIGVLSEVADRIGLTQALGQSKEGKLALWQVLSRVIQQGSKLAAVRLAQEHEVERIIGFETLNENLLYENLDWIEKQQSTIEQKLFQSMNNNYETLYLYDVTSSYFEGQYNELADYGYNRDKKKGKKQIVIGMLCQSDGEPVSVEVFRGNTQDMKTFALQIKKVAQRFGSKNITFVGDRGMIKSEQIENLDEAGFHFITSITKPQIEKLLREGIFQLELFDEDLAEVEVENRRYILRRNPQRAAEIQLTRQSKLQTLNLYVEKLNLYLTSHPRAHIETALKKIKEKVDKLKLSELIEFACEERLIKILINESKWNEMSRLDGCYALITDLSASCASIQVVHERYKDLALVEQAFRTEKTYHLELRPIFVRKKSRTKAHVFIVMLAYRVVRELYRYWKDLNITVEEGIACLTSLCTIRVKVQGKGEFTQIPTPNDTVKKLLDAANVKLSPILTSRKPLVSTSKMLNKKRQFKK